MGFRFRKSFKIAPGIRLNLNKKSVGLRIGGKGAGVSFNSKGRVTKTVGVPGTGLYYTDTSKIGGSGQKKATKNSTKKSTAPQYTAPVGQNTQFSASPSPQPSSQKPDKKFWIIVGAIVVVSVVGFMIFTAVFADNIDTASATEATTEATTVAETWWSVPAFAITQSPTETEPQTEEPTQAPTQRATQAAASTTREQSTNAAQSQGYYILNVETGKYHLPSCRYADSQNVRRISEEEAANYDPCKVCKPR